MGLIGDFMKRKAIDAEAQRLARQLTQRLTPAHLGNEKRRAKELSITLSHLQGYQRKEALGPIGKAKLMETFQWGLVENGYDQETARQICREFRVLLTPKTLPR